MTNKLPEVGKRYRNRKTGQKFVLESIQIIKNHKWYYLQADDEFATIASTYQFKNDYEELPEDNSNQSEVDRIKEKLKEVLSCEVCIDRRREILNFLNALDNQQSNKKQVSVDSGDKLPWKDVSELPKSQNSCSVILKNENDFCQKGDYLSGNFFTDGKTFVTKKYLTTTDLINSIESMLSKQYELEERVRKLEGK